MERNISKKEDIHIDLSTIFYYVKENRWLILLVTGLCLLLGLTYSFTKKSRFQADVLLQVQDNNKNHSGIMNILATNMGVGTNAVENSAAVQSALIQSRFILEKVINANNLDLDIQAKIPFIQKILQPFAKYSLEATTFKIPRKYIGQELYLIYDNPQQFSIYNEQNNFLFQGELAKELDHANFQIKIKEISAPLNTRFLIYKRSQTKIIEWLNKRLTIRELGGKQGTGILQISFTDTEPQRIINILNTIAKVAQIKNTEKKSLEASKTLDFLLQELPLTKADLEKAETKLNAYRAQSGKIDIKLQSQALLTQLTELEKQIDLLRVNRINLLQQHTEAHPFVLSLNSQIAELIKEKEELQQNLKSLPSSDQIAVNLMREVEVKNSLYLILLNKIQELQVITSGTVSDIRILSYAKLPYEPLPAKHGLIGFSSFILGLIISFAIILGRKIIYPRIEDHRWGEQNLDLITLAIIPYCKEKTLKNNQLSQNRNNIPLIANLYPQSLTIESLRSLRTNLEVTLNCTTNNIVAILGISPGIGKTFISSNLAYLLAVMGKKVLLIDCDLRRGMLHHHFNISPKPGLTNLLNKTMALENLTPLTICPNLTVLPRGTYQDNPAELITGKHFRNLLKTLAATYDIVLIDTAPALLFTDSSLIGRMAGTNYLVMGAGAHHPHEVEAVVKNLHSAGVNLHGTIFNFFKQSSNSQFYPKYNAYYKDEKEETIS